MGRKMKPHERPKRFGTSSNPYLVGEQAKLRGKSIEDNPYRVGTDDYKRWKKAFRQAKSDKRK
jgi:ribosome modulation factor